MTALVGWDDQPQARLPSPYRPHSDVLESLRLHLRDDSGALPDWSAVRTLAWPWIQAVRSQTAPLWAVETLLQEFPLSSHEGRALMRLAEALLRVPDRPTAAALTADQLQRASEQPHQAHAHPALGALAARAMELAQRLLPAAEPAGGLLQRLGTQAVLAAAVRAVQLLGRQFVFGTDMQDALRQAGQLRRTTAGLRYSFDMLGEGARTEADAQRYLAAYTQAIAALADAGARPDHPALADGISVKLSALFARYEEGQRGRVLATLPARLWGLVDHAARAGIHLTLDAEESERLELSLDLFDGLLRQAAREHPRWTGLGLAVQAYQTRAADVVQTVLDLAQAQRMRVMLRLVKGAYWDAEIKRAQVLGLDGYPVFTVKAQTDLSYLACARLLLARPAQVFPQFATHNAASVAAVTQLALQAGAHAHDGPRFEWQRLHGMGEALYREVAPPAGAGVLPSEAARLAAATPIRVYAPVGAHRDLLAYLVRRLLENGANASFVHQLGDARITPDALLRSPLEAEVSEVADISAATSRLPDPRHLYGPGRINARGWDVQDRRQRTALLAATTPGSQQAPPQVPNTRVDAIDAAMQSLHEASGSGQADGGWSHVPLHQRCQILRRAADLLEVRLPRYTYLLMHEGRKTLADAVAEVRECIDACRYYAQQAESSLADRLLPGPTGEHNLLRLRGRGVFVCIAPWNFPLAIFGAQVVAALVAGNTVAAKPAEQTPAVAAAFVHLLHEAGVPTQALQLFHGPGEQVGAALVAHPLCAGVAFTGSTATARRIQRSLADDLPPGPSGAARPRAIVPLIAETGGLNAMIVDSSALPEQACDAIVASAFGSAGQRCSALRLLCVQSEIAEPVLDMLAGAMQELVVGSHLDPATDIGPVIDERAYAHLHAHLHRLNQQARLIARAPLPNGTAGLHLIAPCAYEIGAVSDLGEEIFGPVLHVLRYGAGTPVADGDHLLAQIHALGYGLTLGVQTRIDSRAERLATAARVGNVYVNRGMTGAVMGVQPFGGEGLSGTGPKAGGPHYLLRFVAEQVVSTNTAAAGGDAELMAQT